MPKVIIIQVDDLKSYYEQTMDYLHAKYHNYPTDLHNVSVSPEEASRNEYFGNLADEIAGDDYGDDQTPIGKRVQ